MSTEPGQLQAAVFGLALIATGGLLAVRGLLDLAERYPGYAAYRARTRRLIPGVY